MLETMICGLRPRGVTWFVCGSCHAARSDGRGRMVPPQRAVAVDPVGVPVRQCSLGASVRMPLSASTQSRQRSHGPLRKLPVRDPEQLVQLLSRYPGEPRLSSFQWMHYEHYRDRNHAFSELVRMSPARFEVTGQGIDQLSARISGAC